MTFALSIRLWLNRLGEVGRTGEGLGGINSDLTYTGVFCVSAVGAGKLNPP